MSDGEPFPDPAPPPLPPLPPLPPHRADLPEPPPLPPREPAPAPPPPPRRRSRWKRRLVLFSILLAALYLGPLRSQVRFSDDAGRVPVPFDATLRGLGGEKKIRVEDGEIHLLRGRWGELEVSDPFYEITLHRLRGRRMHFQVERNLRLKLKQASTGHPSIPQRGDPDPRNDR